MANSLYNQARILAAGAGINWVSASVKGILIDTGLYTFDVAHPYLNSVAAGARVAVQGLANKVVTSDGACDADDTTFSAVTGSTIEAVILYIHTGTESTSTLLAYLDTVSGLPFQPVGMAIKLSWDASISRIFRL